MAPRVHEGGWQAGIGLFLTPCRPSPLGASGPRPPGPPLGAAGCRCGQPTRAAPDRFVGCPAPMRWPMCTMRRGLRAAGGAARRCRCRCCLGAVRALAALNSSRLTACRCAPPRTRSRCCRAMASALRSLPWPSRWVLHPAALLSCSRSWLTCTGQLDATRLGVLMGAV